MVILKKGIVENNAKVNLGKKEISFYRTNNTHHIYNQMSNEKCRKKKMWKTLLDVQSTCDFIMNISLLQKNKYRRLDSKTTNTSRRLHNYPDR